MEQLISIIIPIYKVEDYLCRCVDSIINQTYQNLEIILVDDGSPDKCPQICDEYAQKDSRIKVIHKENGGLSDARNAGMEVATGDYISYIDSDDWVSLDFFEVLIENAIQNDSDVIECSVVKVYENSEVCMNEEDESVQNFNTEDALQELIGEKNFRQHVWNKLYKTEIVKDILFPVGKLNEDEFWTYKIFGNAKTVTRIHKTMYFYFQRGDSIMGKQYSLSRLDVLEALSERQKYVEQNFESISGITKLSYMGTCMYVYQCCLKYLSNSDRKVAKKRLTPLLEECHLEKEIIKKLSLKRKVWFSFANTNFFLCCRVRNLLGIGF